MGIKKRLSNKTELVYTWDPAVAMIPADKVSAYWRTFDIAELGSFSEMEDKPDVYLSKPLSVEYEHLVNYDEPGKTDFWGIFSTHVSEIRGLSFPVKWENDVIMYKYRKEFSPKTVRNIAQQIISLASDGTDTVFFTVPVDYSAWVTNVRVRHAKERMERDAHSVDATIKKQEQESSP